MERTPPDGPACVIVDADHSPGDMAEVISSISCGCGYPVVVLRGKPNVREAVAVVRCGACDYLRNDTTGDALKSSVREALELDRSGGRRKLQRVRSRLGRLTRRERQVMKLVVQGLANKLIAEQLSVSVKTVEVHRSRVMRKMECGSLANLVRDAMAVEMAEQACGAGI